MAADKSRYKKGMFLIGADHPARGIFKLIVTSRSGPSQRERSVSVSRDAFICSQIFARWGPGHHAAADRPAR